MRIAAAANHFGTIHAVSRIWLEMDIVFVAWLGETRPSRTRIKLIIRAKKRLAARSAFIDARFMAVPILIGKWLLSPFPAANMIALRGKLLFPLIV